MKINGKRYSRDAIDLDLTKNNNLNQYRYLQTFFRGNNGEPIIYPFISYTEMKKYYRNQVIDFRFQVDHISPEKIPLFEEYQAAPANARLFVIILEHRRNKKILDGHKNTHVEVI